MVKLVVSVFSAPTGASAAEKWEEKRQCGGMAACSTEVNEILIDGSLIGRGCVKGHGFPQSNLVLRLRSFTAPHGNTR